ncbi:MAG: tRNA (adenosine(37)-N6)-threonylcarbamoyltransferase complex ATPase subunit type 1 TsaE [Gemmatimonadetes bacterium]|nr:tRNA (adenosine(37)-N6)-threonylcarbamoyltransferase complex ATPase subunit type 1 TsaE [Gemmatimonadota bacterium]
MTLLPATVSEAALEAWGREIGSSVRAPAFFALHGPLGAGKSVLARAIARGMGVTGAVPSPTYTLVQPYEPSPGRRLVHMDLYRIEDPDEVIELGWDDFVGDPEALLVVEWAERAAEHLPRDRWDVRLSPEPGAPELRRLEVERAGRPPALPTAPRGFPEHR